MKENTLESNKGQLGWSGAKLDFPEDLLIEIEKEPENASPRDTHVYNPMWSTFYLT